MNVFPGSLRNYLARVLFPYGSVRRVLAGPCRGLLYRVESGMGVSFALGSDAMNFRFLEKQIKPGMIIYDIGANRGQTTLFFSRLTGQNGKVLSFEPAAANIKILRENTALNVMDNVLSFELAVGEKDGTEAFYYDPETPTMGTLAEVHHQGSEMRNRVDVACRSLDSLIQEGLPAPDFMKVDVEGSAGGVFSGACTLLSRCRPLIYMEVHAASTDAPELEALRLLHRDWGYSICDLQGKSLMPLVPTWGTAAWCVPGN